MAAAAFDPYEVLGVSRGATQDQIRKAYRELVARYHPDKHRGNPLEELAAKKLVEVNRAYEILLRDGGSAGHDDRPGSGNSASASVRAGSTKAAPQPLMSLVRSAGTVLTLIFVLKFGLGIAYKLLLLARTLLVAMLSLLRTGPIVAIVVIVVLTMGTGAALKSRKRP